MSPTTTRLVVPRDLKRTLAGVIGELDRVMEPVRRAVAAVMPSPEVTEKMDAAFEVIDRDPRLWRIYRDRVMDECADEILALARKAPRRAVPQRRPSRQGSTRRRERVAARSGGGARAPGGDDDPPLPPFARTVAVYRRLLASGPVPVRDVWQALNDVGITPKSGTDHRVRRALRIRSHPDGYQGAWFDELPAAGEFVLTERVGRFTVRTPSAPGELDAEHQRRHSRAVVERKRLERLRSRIVGGVAA